MSRARHRGFAGRGRVSFCLEEQDRPSRQAVGYPVGDAVSEQDNLPYPEKGRGRAGHYEVWFLTATDPVTGRGFWLRSTRVQGSRAEPEAGLWFATFDPADPASSFGIHRRHGAGELHVEPDRFEVRVGASVMASGRAEGSAEGGGHSARWQLAWATGEPTYRLLPDALYRGRLAPTKPFSPNVATTVAGWVEIDGQRIEVRDIPAQQGHLFGTRHAERWAWAHCSDFEDGEGTVVQVLTAQQRRGPFLSPWATFAGVRWDGRWIRLSKWRPGRDFGLGTWKIDLESRRYRLTGRIEAPHRALLRARYEDPDGTPRYCHNSEISSSRLALFERHVGGFEEIALLESRGTTHAEWAGRTPAPQVEREVADVGKQA